MPTILDWAGLVIESPSSGTLLRRGHSLLNNNSGGHSFLRSYSFFNPKMGSLFLSVDKLSQDLSNKKCTSAMAQFLSQTRSGTLETATFKEPLYLVCGETSSPSAIFGKYKPARASESRKWSLHLAKHRLALQAHYDYIYRERWFIFSYGLKYLCAQRFS